jgi:hypothetical protein
MVRVKSSMIKGLDYDAYNKEMKIYFHNQRVREDATYCFVSEQEFQNLRSADSPGRYFIENIEPIYKTIFQIKTLKMAKKADKVLTMRVDVSKINKEWLFKGEKGTYLDLTLFYSQEQDQYQTNGMIVQSVPRKIYEVDRNARGPILGNCKDWDTVKQERHAEAQPGSEAGVTITDVPTAEFLDDLPF